MPLLKLRKQNRFSTYNFRICHLNYKYMDTKHPPTTLITNVGNYKFQITAMTILICTRSKLCEKISLTQ